MASYYEISVLVNLNNLVQNDDISDQKMLGLGIGHNKVTIRHTGDG